MTLAVNLSPSHPSRHTCTHIRNHVLEPSANKYAFSPKAMMASSNTCEHALFMYSTWHLICLPQTDQSHITLLSFFPLSPLYHTTQCSAELVHSSVWSIFHLAIWVNSANATKQGNTSLCAQQWCHPSRSYRRFPLKCSLISRYRLVALLLWPWRPCTHYMCPAVL